MRWTYLPGYRQEGAQNRDSGRLEMEKFEVAWFREQGVDLIVVFVDSSFDRKSNDEQAKAVIALQVCATSAGLPGTVVPVWTVGATLRFRAPKEWHPFFQSPGIDVALVANINRELTCDF
jgi:hypothetical protein